MVRMLRWWGVGGGVFRVVASYGDGFIFDEACTHTPPIDNGWPDVPWRRGRTTSEPEAKSNVERGVPLLRHWLGVLVGGRGSSGIGQEW